MTRKQYAVHTVRDEPVRLRDQLDHIAADGGTVVSVIWQPAPQVTLEPGLAAYEVASGYVVVSEHDLPETVEDMNPPQPGGSEAHDFAFLGEVAPNSHAMEPSVATRASMSNVPSTAETKMAMIIREVMILPSV